MSATGGTSGTAMGGAAGNIEPDAGVVADATSSGDGEIDVPASPDTNLPVDQGTGGTATGGATTGGTGGTATGGATTGGTGGTAAGGATTGGTGGTATGGTTTGGTGGTTTGGSAGSQVVDAEIVPDATSPGDGGTDVPFSPDTSLPSDLGTGGSDGAGIGGTDDSATDGAGTGGTDGATGPMIISVRFVGGRPGGSSGTTTMAATESAGVKPATHWNSATSTTGTLSSLVAADDSTTSASIAWTAPNTYTVPFTDASGDAYMMNGFLEAIDTVSVTINVTLPSSMSGGSDVYVYCYGNVDPTTRTYQYKIGSTTHTVSQTGRSVTTFPGYTRAPEGGAGTYVLFSNVTGASFTLTATPASSTAVPPVLRAPVNGIQIVYPSGS